MSAVIVKGIIISLSVVAAVGIALQTPEVREWLDEQRRKLAELLRSVSDGLDAETRREAEAFAFEGRMPVQRDAEASGDALALATGRQFDGDTFARRLNRQTSLEAVDAAERRRLGREYLARRNQEMLELQQRRGSTSLHSSVNLIQDAATSSPTTNANEKDQQLIDVSTPSATAAATFESLVDRRSSLRDNVTSDYPISEPATVVRAGTNAFDAGAQFGNPFADEFSISSPITTDRSATPKPPVPPKLPVSPARNAQPIPIPVTIPSREAGVEDLTYDEQLARALSLSLADKEEKARKTLRRTMTEEEAFARAIVESLKDNRTGQQSSRDVSRSSQDELAQLPGHSTFAAKAGPPSTSSTNSRRTKSDDEDLYFLTPMPTGKIRMSKLLEMQNAAPAAADNEDILAGPARERSVTAVLDQATVAESSTIMPASPSSATLSPLLAARDTFSSGFHTDSENEDYASLPGSSGQSVASMVEVEDVDIESLDEDDDDGIATPSSWSEISSQMDESERSELGAGETIAL